MDNNKSIAIRRHSQFTRDRGMLTFTIIGYIILVLIALACIIPFLMMISGAFSNEDSITKYGYFIFPRGFTLGAFKAILQYPNVILDGYMISISVTVLGTIFSLFLTSMSGYVLSRPDFKYRNGFSFVVYFTTLFSGGLIPWYMVITKVIDLKDNYFALILPHCLVAFNIILFKNFLKAIPNEFTESARIDGAGDFKIYYRIVLPLAKPALATIGLFIALMYWNDWFSSSLFISNSSMYSLQYVLYRILEDTSAALPAGEIAPELPSQTMKLAAAVLTAAPIMALYPFSQRYFVSGLVIGGVKG